MIDLKSISDSQLTTIAYANYRARDLLSSAVKLADLDQDTKRICADAMSGATVIAGEMNAEKDRRQKEKLAKLKENA